MRVERADADVRISGSQTLAILELLIVIVFCVPMMAGLWIAVLGPLVR